MSVAVTDHTDVQMNRFIMEPFMRTLLRSHCRITRWLLKWAGEPCHINGNFTLNQFVLSSFGNRTFKWNVVNSFDFIFSTQTVQCSCDLIHYWTLLGSSVTLFFLLLNVSIGYSSIIIFVPIIVSVKPVKCWMKNYPRIWTSNWNSMFNNYDL